MKNHRNITQTVWDSVFDKMYDSFTTPTKEEGFSDIVNISFKYYTLSFDFDGTIVKNDYPKIGIPIKKTVNLIREKYKQLCNIIIISTCRNEESLREMINFLDKNNIPYDAINYNPIFETGSRKLFAHTYYDDRNGFIESVNGE